MKTPGSLGPVEREAGAIIVRRDGPAPRVLLVTAKANPKEWIFPKGHIEPGETAEQAAGREAMEEAGVEARTIEPAGSTAFSFNGRQIDVKYYLCEYVDQHEATEGRQVAWLPLDEARAKLSFPNLREALDIASTKIK